MSDHIDPRLLNKRNNFDFLRCEQKTRTIRQVFFKALRQIQKHLAFAKTRAMHPKERSLRPRPTQTGIHLVLIFYNRHLGCSFGYRSESLTCNVKYLKHRKPPLSLISIINYKRKATAMSKNPQKTPAKRFFARERV